MGARGKYREGATPTKARAREEPAIRSAVRNILASKRNNTAPFYFRYARGFILIDLDLAFQSLELCRQTWLTSSQGG